MVCPLDSSRLPDETDQVDLIVNTTSVGLRRTDPSPLPSSCLQPHHLVYDPIYNPDRYVFVKNSSWMQLPDQREENITIFEFLLQNKSKFEMTDIKLLATIRDKNDRVIETQEISINGTIPAHDGVMVGTLKPAANDSEGSAERMTTSLLEIKMKEDDSLMSRWSSGVELAMESEGFVEANIDLLQVSAIPKEL